MANETVSMTINGKRLMPSPYAHAIIKDIDTSAAEALPGVHAVVTYKNQPDFSKDFLQGLPPVKKICDEHLRYVGDCVALVVAEVSPTFPASRLSVSAKFPALQAQQLSLWQSPTQSASIT